MPERRTQTPLERKLFLMVDEIGLTDGERIELAQYLLRRDITSWKNLTDDQVLRLADALEGYQLISALLDLRP